MSYDDAYYGGGSRKKKQHRIDRKFKHPSKYKHTPEAFICTQSQLINNRFPTYNDPQRRFQHFFQLPAHLFSRNTHNIHSLVALDCEMVTTTKRRELARISIVSEDGRCIYDKLVKPAHNVIDYCTKYSGITATMLKNVSTTLSDVQSELCQFMDSNTIICGHGLEHDLLVLEMVHYRCIDTSILYPASLRHFKNRLRDLASQFLKRNIQQSQHGHNSHEDALAALDLVKLKLQHGLQKYNSYSSYSYPSYQ